MRIGFIYNPISGNGRGHQLALEAGAMLEHVGFTVRYFVSQRDYSGADTDKIFSQIDAIVVCGGDGTIQQLLPPLSTFQVPVAMLPSGVENLFARQFGMVADGYLLLQVLTNARDIFSSSNWWSEHYFGLVNEKPFFTMVSLGFDASVVQTISQRRTSTIGHRGYILPLLKTWKNHVSPSLTVHVDGDLWIDNESGYLIVANTPQYALRVPWLPEADSSRPTLSARFYPYRTGTDFLKLALTLKLGQKTGANPSASKLTDGTTFDIKAADSTSQFPVQADGDFVGWPPKQVTRAKNCIRVIKFPAA